MKKNLIILLFLSLPFALLAQIPKKGPLDGKTFDVEITKEGKKKPLNPSDNLKFSAGKFKSDCQDFSDWGFTKQSIYKITSIDSTNASAYVYSWTAEIISSADKNEKMLWTGTIKGDDIEGTANLITEKKETKYNYTFSGTLKGKKKK